MSNDYYCESGAHTSDTNEWYMDNYGMEKATILLLVAVTTSVGHGFGSSLDESNWQLLPLLRHITAGNICSLITVQNYHLLLEEP